jgi:hypothetical protein
MTVYAIFSDKERVLQRVCNVGELVLITTNEMLTGLREQGYPLLPGDLNEQFHLTDDVDEGTYRVGTVDVHVFSANISASKTYGQYIIEMKDRHTSSEQFDYAISRVRKEVCIAGVVRKAGIIRTGDNVQKLESVLASA